ncbi:unnamed protein product [Clonostachys rhizophaga]|uniref:Choline monooxygenase, chloroplastic n=1 Tax=Clonostachys rhizophaga TaxID=160324 RepID=A0A9N9W187_9HYPO|nr:unnamed protein product [Clonostachys rhizophaga]
MFSFLGNKSGPSEVAKSVPRALLSSEAGHLLTEMDSYNPPILTTHRSRFSQPGDFVRYEVAGFPFFLCLDRQGVLNGFHNICRHGAFPVVTKSEGTASVLSCKYHGWSYGLSGKLAKAPCFETMPDFDKEGNSLFKIHVHVDSRGFVWVNLDAEDKPSVPWAQDFDGTDRQPRLDIFNMDDFKFDHAWDMKGDYNWKTLIDNYNECYYCSVVYPGIAVMTDLKIYNVEMYEVYCYKDATDEEFEDVDKFFKQVESEDKVLCNVVQKNLNSGMYITGDLYSFNEKGVLYFQQYLKKILIAYHEKEEREGVIRNGLDEEVNFCEGLSCGVDGKKIEW